jgi:hypothetical protein
MVNFKAISVDTMVIFDREHSPTHIRMCHEGNFDYDIPVTLKGGKMERQEGL